MLHLREGERSRFDLRHAAAPRCGYQEVVNYSFVAEEWERDFAGNDRSRCASPIPIASHMSVMRTTLLGGLVQTLRANLNRGEAARASSRSAAASRAPRPTSTVQPERIAGLAFGTRAGPSSGREKGRGVDFFDAKGDLEALAAAVALEFAAGSPSGLPSRPLRRRDRAGRPRRASSASSTRGCSRTTSCRAPPWSSSC